MPPLRHFLRGHRSLLLTALACATLALGAAVARAAEGSATNGRRNIPYRINRADKLGISVAGEAELSVVSRVDPQGFVNLKFVGPVSVYGLPVGEAQKVIEAAYRDGRYLRSPQVTVAIEDYAPRPVVIQGEVKNPNRYLIPPGETMSLLDLVNLAGGFTNRARGTKVKITRKHLDGTTEVFERDVESQLKAKDRTDDAADDLLLEPNDLVFVPERLI